MALPLAEITIITDGWPWAHHNMPCPVDHVDPAVLQISTCVFYPCWHAQARGWMLVKARWRWARWIIHWVSESEAIAR